MRNLIIIEAPSNLGLKALRNDTEPGVRFLPDALRKTGLAINAGIDHCITVPPPPYATEVEEESQIRNAAAIAEYSRLLGREIHEVIAKDLVPVVIGGDCSILLGAALGLKNGGQYGLISIDGHTDYMWPEHSTTHGAAGMDLALVTGNGPGILSDIDERGPYFQEAHVYSFGNREQTDWYVELIKGSNIAYFDLPAVRQHGIGQVTAGFLTMVGRENLDGFWVHLDVDVLNNDIMPCVDSPQEDGLTYTELKETLQPLLASPSFKGISISVLDPTLDEELGYTKAFSDQLAVLLNKIVTGIDIQ
jgi:arginase